MTAVVLSDRFKVRGSRFNTQEELQIHLLKKITPNILRAKNKQGKKIHSYNCVRYERASGVKIERLILKEKKPETIQTTTLAFCILKVNTRGGR